MACTLPARARSGQREPGRLLQLPLDREAAEGQGTGTGHPGKVPLRHRTSIRERGCAKRLIPP